jgi:O-antigen ligase
MFMDHPLTGVGMDNYGLRYQDYYAQVDPNLPCCPMGAHALPIRVLAETGVLGLVALTAIVIVALRGVRSGSRRLRDSGREPLWPFDAIEIGLVGFLVSGLFLDGQYMRTFWIVLALALAARRLAYGREHNQPALRPLAASGFTQA